MNDSGRIETFIVCHHCGIINRTVISDKVKTNCNCGSCKDGTHILFRRKAKRPNRVFRPLLRKISNDHFFEHKKEKGSRQRIIELKRFGLIGYCIVADNLL